MQQTFKAWAKAHKALKAAEANTLMTEEQFHVELARQKRLNAVGRTASKQAVSLEIMASLRNFQQQSHAEGVTLLVISPLVGEKQVKVVITPDMDLEQVCRKLSAYYEAIFAEEELLKTDPIPGFTFKRVPKSKYRLDLYISGHDICLSSTDFGELSRKTLRNLPALVRLAQRVTKHTLSIDGVEVLNPKFQARVKEYMSQAVKAAAEEAILVPETVPALTENQSQA